MLLLVILLIFLATLIYYWWLKSFVYWRKRNCPSLLPKSIYGSLPGLVTLKSYQGYEVQEAYNKLKPFNYGGFYLIRRPCLLLRDPEVIKQIMTKDFNYFRNRANTNKLLQPISYHLFNLGEDKWKAMRVILTPTFTSGKLKNMFNLFQLCCDQLDKNFDEFSKNETSFDIKDVMARFTTDIIGTCAFGLDIDSMNNPSSDFRKIASKIFPTKPSFIINLKLAIYMLFPGFEKYLKLKLIDDSISSFITCIVRETIHYRESNNIYRNDFLNLLIQLKNKGKLDVDVKSPNENDSDEEQLTSEKQQITLGEIVAQCFLFFAAGFETSSSVLSYCCYELSKNPDIQIKIQEEIDKIKTKYNGIINYQGYQEMTYLEQVINETIRKYPTLPVLYRTCTTNYRMPDKSNLIIEKGTKIVIPTYALHHDEQYYPNPNKFDPDRFSPERKHKIPQYAFLPFGQGPRNCIGSRFGLLQTKSGLVTLLSKYKILTTAETPEKLNFVGSPIVSTVDHQIKLKIVQR